MEPKTLYISEFLWTLKINNAKYLAPGSWYSQVILLYLPVFLSIYHLPTIFPYIIVFFFFSQLHFYIHVDLPLSLLSHLYVGMHEHFLTLRIILRLKDESMTGHGFEHPSWHVHWLLGPMFLGPPKFLLTPKVILQTLSLQKPVKT